MRIAALAAGLVVASVVVAAPGAADGDDRLIDWIAAHAERVSILADGPAPGTELAWRVDRVRPLASTFKLLVLAAYAREAGAGRLDPAERITRAALERWYMAGTDGGAHVRAMAAIGARPLTLDDAARAMTEFSDNAATDYLLDRLGRARILATARALDLEALGVGVAPVAGALLTLTDRTLGATVDGRIRRLRTLDAGTRAAHAWRLADRYRADPGRAVAGLEPALRRLAPWKRQLAFADALPWRGSAAGLAALVRESRSGRMLGRAASAVMTRHLSWPLADPTLAARFQAYGGKDGETAGVLTIAGFGRPDTGPWKGRERVVVVMFEGMDAGAWQAARERYVQLATDLADRPEVVARLRERLGR